MITTVGLLDPPLGNMRLQVVRLFSSLLHTQDTRVQREIILSSTCSVMMVRTMTSFINVCTMYSYYINISTFK